jgi:hypothetical protein
MQLRHARGVCCQTDGAVDIIIVAKFATPHRFLQFAGEAAAKQVGQIPYHGFSTFSYHVQESLFDNGPVP